MRIEEFEPKSATNVLEFIRIVKVRLLRLPCGAYSPYQLWGYEPAVASAPAEVLRPIRLPTRWFQRMFPVS